MEIGCVCYSSGITGYAIGTTLHFRRNGVSSPENSIDFGENEHTVTFLTCSGEFWIAGNTNKSILYLALDWSDKPSASIAF
jgi:hypothetical protein